MDTCVCNDHLLRVVSSPFLNARSLRKYLALGANINCQTIEQGFTPLMIAAQGHYARIAEYLLKLGADPLIKNKEQRIASEFISPNSALYPIIKDFELLFATAKNDLMAVEEIIASGGLLSFAGADGKTALEIAVEQNLDDMVEFLLLSGAKPNVSELSRLTCNQNIRRLLDEALDCEHGTQLLIRRQLHQFFTKP